MQDLLQSAMVSVLVAASMIAPAVSIVPSLSPKSHDKFFDHDYPDDHRPAKPETNWQHPFPIVQDSEEYDDDYVKDENSDHGEWKVQQNYDMLRGKLAEEKKLLDADNKRKMVGDTTHIVEADTTNLEDCQKALDAARAKLAGLTKAAKDAKDMDDIKKQIAEEEAKHAEAVKMYETASANFKGDSADLKIAATHLRHVRHRDVDQDGGVYYMTPPPPKPVVALPPPAPAPVAPAPPPPAPKSGAAGAAALPPLLLALALAAVTTASF